ncbi:hypothetical protein B0H16DRAFT_1697840 [Mycena metata]|uniref:Transmembrane protein n=1 Tax=Mycena metata TaxID=1033252 RepID=A0AAD7HTK9_9AGAR|nr:hypothetical protein B0H16DRAFT_1697840 [Mycena metata]
MLFWVFVFLLTRQSSLTREHPNLLVRAPTEGSCDCTINSCRTLFDIIWGCLVTIFACTWVALHQNVPDPAPAAKAAHDADDDHCSGSDFSKTHGFFCNMGGFVSEEGHPVSSIKQLPDYMPAIQKIKKADIEDKSKGDTLSKGVAIAQGLWFVTQCLARVSQHLPLTELEVATLAFAVLSVIIRLLWLHKPLDVQQPIVVARSEVDIDPLQEEDTTPPSDSVTLIDKIFSGISSIYQEYSPLSSTSVPSFYISGIYQEYSPLSSTSVPNFYSIEIDAKDTYRFLAFAGVCGIGSTFGSIHCAAWNALFPSMAEMWIWRISFVFIAAYPALTMLFAAINVWAPYNNITVAVLWSFMVAGFVVYPLCRLFLIILSFTTLRALPPSKEVRCYSVQPLTPNRTKTSRSSFRSLGLLTPTAALYIVERWILTPLSQVDFNDGTPSYAGLNPGPLFNYKASFKARYCALRKPNLYQSESRPMLPQRRSTIQYKKSVKLLVRSPGCQSYVSLNPEDVDLALIVFNCFERALFCAFTSASDLLN